MRARDWAAIGLAALICVINPDARAADSVRVRAAEHPGYGRIVFDWPGPVLYRVETSDARALVRFNRPLSTSFGEVERRLRNYVERISLSDDGVTVEIDMSSTHRVRAFMNQSSVVVDLLAGDVSKPQARAQTGTLALRTERQKQFGRFVFDWGGRVNYTVGRSSDTVTVQFDRAGKVDMPRLWRMLPPQVSAVSAEDTERGLKVELAVPEAQRIRHFRDGSVVVLDIFALASETQAESRRDTLSGRQSGAPTKPVERPSTSQPKHDEPLPVVPTSAPNEETAPAKPHESAPKSGQQLPPEVAGRLVSVDVIPIDSGISVRFNWRSEVAAAVFRRQRTTWIVFGAPARLDLGALRVLGRRVIEHVEQAPASEITALALRGLSVVPERMRRDGTAWTLDFVRASEMAAAPRKTDTLRVEPDPQGSSRLVFSVRALRGPYALRDPDVGDVLSVLPTLEPGAGGTEARQYVDVEVLASLQGVALRPNSEALEVRPERDSIIVTSRPGLKISRTRGVAPAQIVRASVRPLAGIRDWQSASEETLEQQRANLFARVIEAEDSERARARADLARFYFSRRMAADALGVIEVIAAAAPALDLDLRALRGAAHCLLGHYAEAGADFDHPDLRDDPGVLPWRAAIAAARGDWLEAFELTRGSESILAGYPNWLALRLGVILTEAALTVNELEVAKKRLAVLRPLAAGSEGDDYVAILQGYLLKKAGMVDQALSLWRTLSGSDSRLVRARAAFAETTTLYESKRIDGKTAAAKLERLNFAWRGDAYEFDVLRQLGEIYVQNGEPREALSRFRLAATYFENVKGTQVVAARMSEVYRNLYLGDGAEKLPPVTALAMFDEYRELLPSGRDGEEMVRRLADRLVRVDLLSDAAALLENQIEVSLRGLEKAQVGARLAAIRLLDRKPVAALAALNSSDVESSPPDLIRDRKFLQARAYADLGKVREALAVIDGDLDPTAEDLRLAIFWRAAMWREAAATYAARYKDADPATLDDDQTTDIVRWSIASSLAADGAAAEGIRARFADRLGKSKSAEAFRAIVGRASDAPIDYRLLAKEAGDVDAFEKFLAKYREGLRPTAVSQAN